MEKVKRFDEYTNEGVLNVSKVRKFPTYGETRDERSGKYSDRTDFYYIYELNKDEIGKYLNTWFKGSHTEYKGYVTNDEVWTVKKCDKQTISSLYNRIYNPVSLNIVCPVGVKFLKNDKGEDLYDMGARLHSIDDSSFGIYFKQKPYQELEVLRTEMMKWVNSKPIMNGEEFLQYAINLGADNNTLDYG